jgi:hypothetical protein
VKNSSKQNQTFRETTTDCKREKKREKERSRHAEMRKGDPSLAGRSAEDEK